MSNDLRAMAVSCRKAATTLRAEMPKATRAAILTAMARLLVENEVRILAANEEDLIEATKSGVDQNLVSRLKLTPAKIDVLARGIIQLAGQTDPLGEVLRRTEVSPGLNLEQIRVPLGVLLVIFEARPDALPQIAALSIFSGNGLILKGGKEAARSNAVLHSIVSEAIAEVTSGQVPTSLVSLVTSRDEISALLELDDVIDLVIPRGSGSLVKHIQQNTRIPVMGHSEGICHVYLDSAADKTEAINITVDAKINYPAACNAAETVLIHDDLVSNGTAGAVASALAAAGVKIWAGPRVTAAISSGAAGTDSIAPHIAGPVKTFKHEYGDLEISFETVESMTAAIDHIATYGSRHTESIVTENNETAAAFMATVDAACVFHNASTRFADGFRFGLGAEVGISTSPIHARGPVGVEGLTSTKWLLNSDRGHTVGAFASGEFEYTHKKLPINQ